MVMVNLPSEALDSIIQNTLIQDYRQVMEDIRRLLHREGEIKAHEREDLDSNLDFKAGYESLLKYYVVASVADELIEEENGKLDSWDNDEEDWDLQDDQIDADYVRAVDEKTNILSKQLYHLQRMFDEHVASVRAKTDPMEHSPENWK